MTFLARIALQDTARHFPSIVSRVEHPKEIRDHILEAARYIYRWSNLEPPTAWFLTVLRRDLRPRGKRLLLRFGCVWRVRRSRKKILPMADSPECEDEREQIRATTLETATTVLKIRQSAEQEIRQTNQEGRAATQSLHQGVSDQGF